MKNSTTLILRSFRVREKCMYMYAESFFPQYVMRFLCRKIKTKTFYHEITTDLQCKSHMWNRRHCDQSPLSSDQTGPHARQSCVRKWCREHVRFGNEFTSFICALCECKTKPVCAEVLLFVSTRFMYIIVIFLQKKFHIERQNRKTSSTILTKGISNTVA